MFCFINPFFSIIKIVMYISDGSPLLQDFRVSFVICEEHYVICSNNNTFYYSHEIKEEKYVLRFLMYIYSDRIIMCEEKW